MVRDMQNQVFMLIVSKMMTLKLFDSSMQETMPEVTDLVVLDFVSKFLRNTGVPLCATLK